MSQTCEFHNLEKPEGGIVRELAPGLAAHIFAGEKAMLGSTPTRIAARSTVAHARARSACVVAPHSCFSGKAEAKEGIREDELEKSQTSAHVVADPAPDGHLVD